MMQQFGRKKYVYFARNSIEYLKSYMTLTTSANVYSHTTHTVIDTFLIIQ